MQLFSWMDNRTLIACDCMLSIAFACVFFGMKRSYPSLRGISTIAIGFLLGVPGTVLLDSRGSIPMFVSVTVAVCFVFGSFIFLYRGILRFIGSRRTSLVPIAASCISLPILLYYSQIDDRFVPRVVALSLTVGLIRGLIALELFRKSPTFTSPRAMRAFAACMGLFAALTVNAGVMAVLYGMPSDELQTNAVGSMTLFFGLLSTFATGVFILVLSSGELIDRSVDEAHKDSLSGVFNRRGIELKLAAALKRIERGNYKLSVALIDLDYFKSINDTQGHAAGDTAIRNVAETISTHLRGRDHLGRYGGDEFLLILPQTPCSIALTITERLCQAMSSLGCFGRDIPLTLSIGLTEAVLEDDAVTVIARADKALYQAKRAGRNCREVILADSGTTSGAGAPETVVLGHVTRPVGSSL